MSENILTPEGKRIKELLVNYQLVPRCTSCRTRMVKGRGFYVCPSCGLEGEVYYENRLEASIGESDVHKYNRNEKPANIQRRDRMDFVRVKITKKANDSMHKHVKKNFSYWMSDAILEKIKRDETNG